MTASLQSWRDPLNGSSIDGIEEGLLDEHDDTTRKFHETSATFPRTSEHGWKELVSDPSLSEVDISEKTREYDSKAAISRKHWDHHLSTFSLNDGDNTKFTELEVHTDHVEDIKDLEISDRIDVTENFRVRNDFGTGVMEDVESVALLKVSTISGVMNTVHTQGSLNQENIEQESSSKNISRATLQTSSKTRMPVDWQPLIQIDEGPPISNVNALWQTGSILRSSYAPAREAVEMQASANERNILPTDVNEPDVMFTSYKSIPSIDSDMLNTGSRSDDVKTFQQRPRSALERHGVTASTHLTKRSSSFPRANSAPLWQGDDTTKQSLSLGAVTTTLAADFQTEKVPSHFDHMGQVKPKGVTVMDDWESPLEQRKISGADEDVADSVSKTTFATARDPLGEASHDKEQRNLVGNVSTNALSAYTTYSTSRANSGISRQATGLGAEVLIGGKENISIEDFLHPSGDGTTSKDVNKGTLVSPSKAKMAEEELGLEQLLEDGNRHSIVGSGSEMSNANVERDSGLLEELRTNTNSTSSTTQRTLNGLDHTESVTESSSIATSREAAENLPVRPLTIGNSLTIGSSVAYRPISPFQPDPTGGAWSNPTVPPTTPVTATYVSTSQYSEGILDAEEEEEDEGGDMSARERLQPLGRVGLEVKQGPPWGITMPLFQPDSRDSSLSSNDSNVSNSQFQAATSQQPKAETEPLLSRSSTPSETDLSRKASVKSLETKEPMGVKMLNEAENLRTPIGKFHQLHPADGDSPVSKILGPTFKATQKMLEELQRRPLQAYDEDLDQLTGEEAENLTSRYESETPINGETVVADGGSSSSSSHAGQEEDAHEESMPNQDRRRSQESRHSHDSRSSRTEIERLTRNSYHESSANQRTPDLIPVTTALPGILPYSSGIDDIERAQNNRTSSRGNKFGRLTHDSYNGSSINQDTAPSTSLGIVDIERTQNSRPSSRENESEKLTRDSYHRDSVNQNITPTTTTYLGARESSTRSSGADELRRDSRPSSRKNMVEKLTHDMDSYHGDSINQQTLDVTPTTTAYLNIGNTTRSSATDELRRVQDGVTSFSAREVKKPSMDAVNEFSEHQHSLESTPIVTANVASNTRGPVVSLKDGYPRRMGHDLVSRQYQRIESHKTSGMTDSTLGNSIGLPGHLICTGVQADYEGAAKTTTEPPASLDSHNQLEDRTDASDLSEFDRVASESISWSNALASQFREEMKSLDLDVQERLQDDETLVNPTATSPFLDSGLSESSTNDEMYLPKRLARLSADNGPIGVYDVRQSSGPGSTNRKRLALGRKPRESSKSWLNTGIYVSDGTTGASGTDRDKQRKSRQSRHRVEEGAYVSEGTTSGTEPVDDRMDSGPDGQSTPKSDDISATQINSPTTDDFSAKASIKPITDMYLGLTNFEFEKPTGVNHSSFTTYEVEKPTSPPSSAFMNYKSERQTRQDPPPFSTFDIDKPTRANNPPGTSRNAIVNGGRADFGMQILAVPQRGSNVTRLQPAARVEHTWSISKPVMSQLSTKAAPLAIQDFDREPRKAKKQQQQQQPLGLRASHQPEHHRKRATRHKETLPKTVRQHAKDRSSESIENEKIPDNSGPTESRKKSVADVILENMIRDEQEQKKRHKKIEAKQEQASQDLDHLWERFQDVFGKKSRSPRDRKTASRPVRSRPSRATTPTDVSLASSSSASSGGKRSIGRQSLDIITDSDEEFERFLSRIRELQSSESSYAEDKGSTISRLSSSNRSVVHDKSLTTPSDRKPRHKVVDNSTSMTSIASSDDGRARRNESHSPSRERPLRKTPHQNVGGLVPASSSVSEKKAAAPVTIPMWLSVTNKGTTRKGKASSSCTCGAKSRQEKPKPSGVRDIGVNCPTPPIVPEDSLLPVATDIAVLKAAPVEEAISPPVPASLVKLSLQDAFMYSKQEFIERSRKRIKKVSEKREERKSEKTSSAQVVVVVPNERTRATKELRKSDEDRMIKMKSSREFEQLQRKRPRPMSTKEIRDVNKRIYKNLPEIRKRRDEERRAEFYKTNRLRAQLYGKHVRNTNRIFTVA